MRRKEEEGEGEGERLCTDRLEMAYLKPVSVVVEGEEVEEVEEEVVGGRHCERHSEVRSAHKIALDR